MKPSLKPRSFSSAAKEETCREYAKDCCVMAELSAAIFACGSLIIDGSGSHISFTTENMAFAKRLYNIIKHTLKLDADIAVCESALKNKKTYEVTVRDGELLLKLIGVTTQNMFSGCPQTFITRRNCCKKAALRGAFLGCGTASDPRKNYRVEFVTKNETFADFLLRILKQFDICAKKVRRKERYVIYLNEGDAICALMSKIGAHTSLLNFENIRVLKETRNNVNRAVNCETANISKTITAAANQIESINVIERTIGIAALPEKLRETCLLRLNNREASLTELCELTGATKSAINHRFRKIGEIAKSLKGE